MDRVCVWRWWWWCYIAPTLRALQCNHAVWVRVGMHVHRYSVARGEVGGA